MASLPSPRLARHARVFSSTSPTLSPAPPQPTTRRRLKPEAPGRIAVVGGGLSGLTTAHYLSRNLPPEWKIDLYESTGRIGGWVRSDTVRADVGGVSTNVMFERGPRTMPGYGPKAAQTNGYVLAALHHDLELSIYSPKASLARYVYYADQLNRVPASLSSLVTGLNTPVIWDSLPGMARAMRWAYTNGHELQDERLMKDVSVADFMRRIGGGDSLTHMASAMLHGIWGGDIEQLSAHSVLGQRWFTSRMKSLHPPAVWASRADAQMRGVLRSLDSYMQGVGGDGAPVKHGEVLHYGGGGMETLTQRMGMALASCENVDIKLNTEVMSITPHANLVQARVTSPKTTPQIYDKVIAAVPAHHLARMTKNQGLTALSGYRSATLMVVNLWYPTTIRKPAGLGYLIPSTIPASSNPERALGVFFDSDVGIRGPDEPAESTKLTVLMGGHYYDSDPALDGRPLPIPDQEQAVRQAKAVLHRQLQIPLDTPCFGSARLARDCIPQHTVGHGARNIALQRQIAERFKGTLAVAGGSYTRPGVLAAVRAGWDVAWRLCAAVRNEQHFEHGWGVDGFDIGAETLPPREYDPRKGPGKQWS